MTATTRHETLLHHRQRSLLGWRYMTKAARLFNSVIYRTTTTRAVLTVVGVVCGFYAYSTYHAYTLAELPLRNSCVMILIAIAILGVGSAAIHPNAVMRSSVGILVLLHSVLRGGAVAYRAWVNSGSFGGFLGHANAMWVHVLVAYTGLLLWARSHQDPVR